MWLIITKSLVVSSEHVIYIYLVAYMVIPCRVENYRVKCRLTYAVGCKSAPPLKQYPPAFRNFTLGWNSYVLTHHVVG